MAPLIALALLSPLAAPIVVPLTAPVVIPLAAPLVSLFAPAPASFVASSPVASPVSNGLAATPTEIAIDSGALGSAPTAAVEAESALAFILFATDSQ